MERCSTGSKLIDNVLEGGLEIEGIEGSGDFTLIANAAIIVKLDI